MAATRPSPRRLFVLTILLLHLVDCSDSTPVENQLEARWEEARKVYREQGAAASLPLFEGFLEEYRQAGDPSGEARSLAQIGNCYKQLGEYERSLEFLGQARRLNGRTGNRTEEGWTINSIGLVQWEMAHYEEAFSHFDEALRIAEANGETRLEATVRNNMALVHDELGNYDRSRLLYQSALEDFQKLGDRYRESYVLGNLGGVLLLTGDFREAAKYYRQALDISRELGSRPSQAIDQGNLGLCLLGMGNVDEALQQLDSALELSREAGQFKEQADWHHGKASLYLRTGRYPLALAEYQSALETYSKSGLKRQQSEALVMHGELHLLLGDPATAERDYRQGLALAREIGYRRGEILHLILLGDLQQRRKEHDLALSHYEEALQVAETTGDRLNTATSSIRKAVTLRQLGRTSESLEAARNALASIGDSGAVFAQAEGLLAVAGALADENRFSEALATLDQLEDVPRFEEDPEVAWRTFHTRGHALEGLGQRDRALDSYSRAIDVLQNVRYRLRDAGLGNAYLEDRYEPYLDVARLSIRSGLPGKAYEASLRLRLRSYQDLLDQDPSSTGVAAGEPELREKISTLRRAIEERKIQPVEEQQPAALDHLLQELNRAQNRYEQLTGTEEPDNWREMILSGDLPSLQGIQRQLSAGSAVVEYLVDEGALYTFVVRSDSVRGRSDTVDSKELAIRVDLLRSLIADPDSDDWVRPSRRLYGLLIEPLRADGWLEGVRELFIVPHRMLHYLPFAVLARPDGDKVRLLLEDYELSYLPSTMLLMPGAEQQAGRTLLAMAPGRARLRFHQEEVQRLSATFPPPFEVLLGKSARESVFKRDAGDSRVVHLATHGQFNRWNPLLSALQLEADDSEDGDLQVREILGLKLRSDLVTLSACETGLGSGQYSDLPPGDEFQGLTQAFLFAGSRGVLASLWDVDDRSTSEVMQAFYEQREQLGPARALRLAQLAMLQHPTPHCHPLFWAGFSLFGGMQRTTAGKTGKVSVLVEQGDYLKRSS